jgi:hypothetical protein
VPEAASKRLIFHKKAGINNPHINGAISRLRFVYLAKE